MSFDFSDISFAWPGRPALFAGVNLTLNAGQRLSLLGGNGAGKTTLARCLAGRQPCGGAIRVDGTPLSDLPRAERAALVQYVPQRPHLFLSGRGLTVRDEVAFGPENLCLPAAEIAHRTGAALTMLGIAALADRDARHLSGGQQQRVALAGALAMQPRLLILDEPMTDLDAETRDRLVAHLRAMPWNMSVLVLDSGCDPWLERMVGGHLLLQDGHVEGPLTVNDLRTRAPAAILLPQDAPLALPPLVPAADPLVRLMGVDFAWPGQPPLFSRLSATIPAGAAVALLGPNGSGKSTFLRLIAGLHAPARGRVEVAGLDPANATPPEIARIVGAVLQASDRHFLCARVLDEVTLGPVTLGLRDPQALARDALAQTGLTALAHAHPLDLDTGQRRLLSLAAAIAHRPLVLLLDEVQRGLDAHHRAQLLHVLETQRRQGTTILLATHDTDFAGKIADTMMMFPPSADDAG